MRIFLYEEPGYFRDTTGERWLVGEDPDGDLVGINVLSPDPQVQYWDPCGRVLGTGTKPHARDLIGPSFAKRPKKDERSAANNFHHATTKPKEDDNA